MSTSTAPRPADLLVRARDELAQLDQWVIGARDKRPLTLNDAGDGLRGASHSEPTDWMTYAAAQAAIRFDGAWLGFVFSEADPYTGIDIDGCRDPETGKIEPWAQYWIARLDGTELRRVREQAIADLCTKLQATPTPKQ